MGTPLSAVSGAGWEADLTQRDRSRKGRWLDSRARARGIEYFFRLDVGMRER